MSGKGSISRKYTKQGSLFENWPSVKGKICPVCKLFYVTRTKTGVSMIYIHANFKLCEVRRDEIRN